MIRRLCFHSSKLATHVLQAAVLLIAFAASASGPLEPLRVVKVQTPDGDPLPNVTVAAVDPTSNLYLNGPTLLGGQRFQTDAQGNFSLPAADTNVFLVVAAPGGFGCAQASDFVGAATILVRAWGRIEGRRLDHGRPVVGQQIRFRPAMSYLGSDRFSEAIYVTNFQVTDGDGRFALDFVPPIQVYLSATQLHPPKGYVPLQRLRIPPGKTARTEIDTGDGTMIAQFRLDPSLAGRFDLTALDVGLRPDMDMKNPALWPVIPKEEDTAARRSQWWDAWNATENGRRRLDMFRRLRGMEIHADGSAVADLIEPGHYILDIDAWQNGRNLVDIHRSVTLPPGGTAPNVLSFFVIIALTLFRRLRADDPYCQIL